MKRNRIPAGRIVNAHGVRGEVRVLPIRGREKYLLDRPTLYLDGQSVCPSAARRHKNFILLKLPGTDTCDAALSLKGKEVFFARSDAPDVPYFEEELIGIHVFDGETGAALGVLTEVEDYPASAVYTVEGDRKWLIPAVEGAFILSVDLDANRMDVRVWEGLEELDRGGTGN